LFDPLSEAGDVRLELVGHGVNVFRVTLTRLRQFGCRGKKLFGIRVSVLKDENYSGYFEC
jgi:hypothetical protein